MSNMRFVARESLEWLTMWRAIERAGYGSDDARVCRACNGGECWQYLGSIGGRTERKLSDIHQFRHRDYPGRGRLYLNVRNGIVLEPQETVALSSLALDRQLVWNWTTGRAFDALLPRYRKAIMRLVGRRGLEELSDLEVCSLASRIEALVNEWETERADRSTVASR